MKDNEMSDQGSSLVYEAAAQPGRSLHDLIMNK